MLLFDHQWCFTSLGEGQKSAIFVTSFAEHVEEENSGGEHISCTRNLDYAPEFVLWAIDLTCLLSGVKSYTDFTHHTPMYICEKGGLPTREILFGSMAI